MQGPFESMNTRILKFIRDVCQDCNARDLDPARNKLLQHREHEFIIVWPANLDPLGNLDPRETRFWVRAIIILDGACLKNMFYAR